VNENSVIQVQIQTNIQENKIGQPKVLISYIPTAL
jgi:hypothetical protein